MTSQLHNPLAGVFLFSLILVGAAAWAEVEIIRLEQDVQEKGDRTEPVSSSALGTPPPLSPERQALGQALLEWGRNL